MRKPKDQLIEAAKAVQPTLSRAGRIQRAFWTHVATGVLVGVLSYGLAAEDAHTAIAAERSTYQQLAVYAGCAHVDQVGNFSWTAFPTAMDDATGEPIKAKRAKIVKVKGGAQ